MPETYSTVYDQLALHFVNRGYIAGIHYDVIEILPITGHEAVFSLRIGGPNYSQSYNFLADNHVFFTGNYCIRIDGLEQDDRSGRHHGTHGAAVVDHRQIAVTHREHDQIALGLESVERGDVLFDIRIIKGICIPRCRASANICPSPVSSQSLSIWGNLETMRSATLSDMPLLPRLIW